MTKNDFLQFMNGAYPPNQLWSLDQFGSEFKLPPIGAYFIYRQTVNQPAWWSYNLQKLKEGCDQQGGFITDEVGRIVYSHYEH